MYGLFHARKLRAHELALRMGWDAVHPRLGLTERFYGWFTPAIARLGLRAARRARGRPGSRAGLPRGVPSVSAGRDRGALAIVLHTHMPYVEGFGTWPFGEEWLWEAMAGCYLPLLELLDRGAPLTLSLTPVLCDQLEAPGVAERFARVRRRGPPRHPRAGRRGLRAGGHEALARELERSWGDYTGALESLHGGAAGTCSESLAPHAQWTSSATHAVLPLLATDAGVRLQVQTGVDAHRAPLRRRAGAAASGCRSARTRRGSSGRSRTPA